MRLFDYCTFEKRNYGFGSFGHSRGFDWLFGGSKIRIVNYEVDSFSRFRWIEKSSLSNHVRTGGGYGVNTLAHSFFDTELEFDKFNPIWEFWFYSLKRSTVF